MVKLTKKQFTAIVRAGCFTAYLHNPNVTPDMQDILFYCRGREGITGICWRDIKNTPYYTTGVLQCAAVLRICRGDDKELI